MTSWKKYDVLDVYPGRESQTIAETVDVITSRRTTRRSGGPTFIFDNYTGKCVKYGGDNEAEDAPDVDTAEQKVQIRKRHESVYMGNRPHLLDALKRLKTSDVTKNDTPKIASKPRKTPMKKKRSTVNTSSYKIKKEEPPEEEGTASSQKTEDDLDLNGFPNDVADVSLDLNDGIQPPAEPNNNTAEPNLESGNWKRKRDEDSIEILENVSITPQNKKMKKNIVTPNNDSSRNNAMGSFASNTSKTGNGSNTTSCSSSFSSLLSGIDSFGFQTDANGNYKDFIAKMTPAHIMKDMVEHPQLAVKFFNSEFFQALHNFNDFCSNPRSTIEDLNVNKFQETIEEDGVIVEEPLPMHPVVFPTDIKKRELEKQAELEANEIHNRMLAQSQLYSQNLYTHFQQMNASSSNPLYFANQQHPNYYYPNVHTTTYASDYGAGPSNNQSQY